MDSMGKISKDLRAWAKNSGMTVPNEYADRIDALMREPVAEVNIVELGPNMRSLALMPIDWWLDLPSGAHKLFAAPPTASTQDLDDFLSRVQARVIELGYMPPAWPTSECDGTDDPVESAARMICGLLDAAQPAPASEKYKATIAELCDCFEDVMNNKGGWAWEEVIQDARNFIETAQ